MPINCLLYTSIDSPIKNHKKILVTTSNQLTRLNLIVKTTGKWTFEKKCNAYLNLRKLINTFGITSAKFNKIDEWCPPYVRTPSSINIHVLNLMKLWKVQLLDPGLVYSMSIFWWDRIQVNLTKLHLNYNFITPVSYTHLDVYKRQMYVSTTYLRYFATIWFNKQ